MQPAVARKLIESFNDAMSVQLFVKTTIVETHDENDLLPTEELFNLYRQWPPRIRMNEARFIQFLRTTCKLDVTEYDHNEPTLIVGVTFNKELPRNKRGRYQKAPPPMQAIQRAARFATNVERAKALGISPRALRGLCKRNPEVAALFCREL